jgi:uncharacterized protein (TIGR02466 family)
MAGTLQLANLFETPLILDVLPDAAALNAELKTVIARRRDADSGVRKSNWNGWQSEVDMLAWGGQAATRIADHFIGLCNNFSWVSDPGAFVWSVDMWANVSPAGASNEAHVHPGVVWSSVYYVEDGYNGSADPALGGELVLYDPRMPFVRMLPFDVRYRRPDGRPGESQTAIRPTAGQIVMFPPWLLHSVHPFHGHGERISIAMNAIAVAQR